MFSTGSFVKLNCKDTRHSTTWDTCASKVTIHNRCAAPSVMAPKRPEPQKAWAGHPGSNYSKFEEEVENKATQSVNDSLYLIGVFNSGYLWGNIRIEASDQQDFLNQLTFHNTKKHPKIIQKSSQEHPTLIPKSSNNQNFNNTKIMVPPHSTLLGLGGLPGQPRCVLFERKTIALTIFEVILK